MTREFKMEMYTIEEITEDAIILIAMEGWKVIEVIDTEVLIHDLNAGERRQLIQRLAKEGYKS
jgi:hypothetical protein